MNYPLRTDYVSFGEIPVSYSKPCYQETFDFESASEVSDHFEYEEFNPLFTDMHDTLIVKLFKHKFAVATGNDFKRHIYRLVQTGDDEYSLSYWTQDCLETVDGSIDLGED